MWAGKDCWGLQSSEINWGDQGLSREWGFPQPHSGIVDTRDQEERKQKKPESAMTLQLRAGAEKRKM